MKRARLFNRAFDIDLESAPNRGGEPKIITVILWCEPRRQRCRGPFWPVERRDFRAPATDQWADERRG